MTKRLNLNDLKSIYKKHGCTLLEQTYVNARTPMKFRCACGKISKARWDNLRDTMRCQECGVIACHNKQKHTYDYVKTYFSSNKCKLLETTYNNAKTLMKYVCICGNESKIRFSDFNRGMRCKQCYLTRISGENHHMWHKDRERYADDKLFKKRCYSLLRHTLKVIAKDKSSRTNALLGYSVKDLKTHIMSHPNWNKVKDEDETWHIDHVFPITAFLDHHVYDVKLINALDNLQPLSASNNSKKSNKYDKHQFVAWLKDRSAIK